MHRPRFGWIAFGGFVALNAVWLYHDVASDRMETRHDEAYAECRSAIRRSRPDAARIPFPTTDLIRVSQDDSAHFRVSGFFAPRGAPSVWYRCELSRLAEQRWRIDRLVFDRR